MNVSQYRYTRIPLSPAHTLFAETETETERRSSEHHHGHACRV